MSLKYNLKERKQWVESLNTYYNEQDWHQNPVYHPSEILYSTFFKENKSYKSKIDPRQIVGVEYGFGYNSSSNNKIEYTWNYHLGNLKRLDRVIDNKKSLSEIHDHINSNNDPKSVWKYGGNYFITSGQHRLCLAKYFELSEVEVNVREFKLDRKRFIQEKFIEKNKVKMINLGLVDIHFDNNIDHHLLNINLNNKSYSIHKSLVREFLDKYEDLKKNKIKAALTVLKWFIKPIPFDNKNYIRNSNELFFLDYDLVKQIIKNKEL